MSTSIFAKKVKEGNSRRRPLGLVICVAFLSLIMVIGLLGSWITPHDPNKVEVLQKFMPPSSDYWLGTDQLGRDILSRLMTGVRVSLGSSILVVLVSMLIGIVLGPIAALRGGWIDAVLMRLCDLLMAFPNMILSFAILGMFGPGFINLVIALVFAHWMQNVRMVRDMVLVLKGKAFMQAAKISGTNHRNLLTRHILPNIASQLVVIGTLQLGRVILEITSLSFLGLGVQPPTPEWGMMIKEAMHYIRINPNMILYPGILVVLVVSTINLLGDYLKERYDPKER